MAVTCHKNHRCSSRYFLSLTHKIQIVVPRHLDVGNEQVVVILAKQPQCFRAVRRAIATVAPLLEKIRGGLTECVLIVGDQDRAEACHVPVPHE